MQKAFSCAREQVIIHGHSRNDVLFEQKKEFPLKADFKKMIFWLPTYRYDNRAEQTTMTISDVLPLMKSSQDLIILNKLLEQYNILLLIKLHPLQNLDMPFPQLSHIRLFCHAQFNQAKLNLYPTLKESDALITDYSSIFFDYLLLNRPIGFDICDIESYKSNRGLVFDNPLDFMPGAKIQNLEDLLSFITDLAQGNDRFKQERKKINDLSNFYQDGNFSQKLLKDLGL